MDQIAIETTQNIAIEQTIASVGERIVATIIDLSFVGTFMLFLSFFNIWMKDLEIFFAILFLIPLLFYHLVSELAMGGQTWGKKIMKIKVMKIDGTEADAVSFMIRWVFRLVDILILFGAISTIIIILNGKGQRLGDIAAHTTVIRLKDRKLSTIYTKLPDDYSLVYYQVNRLTDQDIHIAREILEFTAETYCSAESIEMAASAKKAFEIKMGLRSELKPEAFLQTVVKDYNFIHSR